MGEPVYRSERVGIRLVNRGSTFGSRFRLWLKAARGPIVAFAGACAALGVLLLGGLGIMVWMSPADFGETRGWFGVGGLTILAAFMAGLVAMLAAGAIKSTSPDPAEQLLPRELHLFEDNVMVVPTTGTAFHTPWGAYILGATATPSGLRLLLGREPRLEFFVRREALTPDQWRVLDRWLVAQGLTPDAAPFRTSAA